METKICEEKLQAGSLGETLGKLAGSSAALVRDEIELVKQQAREKIKDLRNGIIMAVAGWLLAVGALWCFIAALVLVLCLYMPPGCAAAAVGLGILIIGAALGYFGLRQFKKPVP